MASNVFPIDAAQLVGFFMQSIFYGCMGTLLWSEGGFKPLRLVNVKMLIASALMFIVGSLSVSFHLRHNMEAFIWNQGSAIEVFNDVSSWISLAKTSCYVTQTFVGDTILIFRCWVVYERNWLVVAVPILFWLGTISSGIMMLVIQAKIGISSERKNTKSLVPVITSMLCLTLATTVLTTSLILYRIWRIRSNLGNGRLFIPNSPLTRVVIVIIESGLLYTLSVIIMVSLYLARNAAQYGLAYTMTQIIGITFNLVITSVNRRDVEQGTLPTTLPPTIPLRKINVHTTIDRYVDHTGTTSEKSDIGSDIQDPIPPKESGEWYPKP